MAVGRSHLPVRSTCGGTLKGRRLQSSTRPVSRPLCSWRWPVVCCPWHHRFYPAGGRWSCWPEIYHRGRRRESLVKLHNILYSVKVLPTTITRLDLVAGYDTLNPVLTRLICVIRLIYVHLFHFSYSVSLLPPCLLSLPFLCLCCAFCWGWGHTERSRGDTGDCTDRQTAN